LEVNGGVSLVVFSGEEIADGVQKETVSSEVRSNRWRASCSGAESSLECRRAEATFG
jgi:hypothetical protein